MVSICKVNLCDVCVDACVTIYFHFQKTSNTVIVNLLWMERLACINNAHLSD